MEGRRLRARGAEIGHPTHAELGYSADSGGPPLPQTTPIDSSALTRGRADCADIPLPVGSTEDRTMTYSISMNSGRAEPLHTATDLNHPSGDAGCAARLPRQPIAPNDHAAVMPDLAFDGEDQGDPPVAEADRPVALVIEDDPATCRQITAVLMRAGWSVLPARDGEQGLVMARMHVPEVVLVDLALPRMSGLEVLRELRSARWEDQPTPVVVVVSFFAMLLRLPDLRLADGLVQKPFRPADLLAQVAVARARHRAPVLI